MQHSNFPGGLALGIELLRGLAADELTREGDTVPEPDGAGFDIVSGKRLLAQPRILPCGGGRVEHDQNGSAGGSQEGERIGDRLEIEDCRPAGDEDQIGGVRRFERGAVGMRGGIDVEHLAAELADPRDLMA